jgi:hypothetical protein
LVALTSLGFILILAGVGQAHASWVRSRHEAMIVNHPPGWKVVWRQHQVVISHPRDRRIWCSVGADPWTGPAQGFVARAVSRLKSRFARVRVVGRGRVSSTPDTYGVRVIFDAGKVPQGMLILSTVVGGRWCLTRSYGAPAASYDHWKRWLIPILLSFRLAAPAGAGSREIKSPGGYWRFRAPPGWTAAPLGPDEPFRPTIAGPGGRRVGVYNFLGQLIWASYLERHYRGRGIDVRRSPRAYMRFIYQTHIPLLSATRLLRQVVLPMYGQGVTALRIEFLKRVGPHAAWYRISFRQKNTGQRLVEEGIIRNDSVPNPQGGDLNPFTMFWVRAPAVDFDRERDSLWRIVRSFQPTPRFEPALLGLIARVRRENVRAMHQVVRARIQSNRRMVRQTMRTTLQVQRDHRQTRRGWAWALADRQVVRDPQTGRQYVVPAGGEYIYVRPSGGGGVDVIRSNAPLPPGDLPLGFRRFEQVPLSQIR